MSLPGTARLIASVALLMTAGAACGNNPRPQPTVADAAADGLVETDASEEDRPSVADARADANPMTTPDVDARDTRALDMSRDTEPAADVANDAKADAVQVKPNECFAGNKCSGGATCQYACFMGRVNTCSCADGHFFCTGCLTVDAGADARDFPDCGANAQGKRCNRAGDVCDYRADGGAQLLCVCGTIGTDHAWICQ
jgi:hypothetical protein